MPLPYENTTSGERAVTIERLRQYIGKASFSSASDKFSALECLTEIQVETNAWQPIETAPDDTLVVVGWLDPEDAEHPERHDFDYKEDGCWVRHADSYEHYCMVAPPESEGPKETAPYTHWMEVPEIPRLAAIAKERTA